jgi:hypothetical protein
MQINKHTQPNIWFHVTKIFTEQEQKIIMDYIPQTPIDINGNRGETSSIRTFVTKNSSDDIRSVFESYLDKKDFFTEVTGVDCTNGKLRVELVADNLGSHLDKHIDIPEKLITLQIYMGEGEANWGTTIYNDWDTQFYTVPFVQNTGWMTHAGGNIIHGVKPNVVTDKRYSVIINYVQGDWRDTNQLWDG